MTADTRASRNLTHEHRRSAGVPAAIADRPSALRRNSLPAGRPVAKLHLLLEWTSLSCSPRAATMLASYPRPVRRRAHSGLTQRQTATRTWIPRRGIVRCRRMRARGGPNGLHGWRSGPQVWKMQSFPGTMLWHLCARRPAHTFCRCKKWRASSTGSIP